MTASLNISTRHWTMSGKKLTKAALQRTQLSGVKLNKSFISYQSLKTQKHSVSIGFFYSGFYEQFNRKFTYTVFILICLEFTLPDVTSFLLDNMSGLKNRLYSGFDGYMVRWRFPNLIQGSKKILEANLENRRWPSLGQNNEKCLLQHNMCFFNMPASAQYVLLQHNMCFLK